MTNINSLNRGEVNIQQKKDLTAKLRRKKNIPLPIISTKSESEELKTTTKSISEKIQNERQSYAESLTIHGLSRIATGRRLTKVVCELPLY